MSPSCAHIYVLAWQTMLSNIVFNFSQKKNPFFIFGVSKREIFVKHLPRICFKMAPYHFCKILDHVSSIIHQLVAFKIFLASSRKKRQVYVDTVGTVPNLNYKCFVVCSWFFTKIIFRYKTCDFIRDTLRVLQDSTFS